MERRAKNIMHHEGFDSNAAKRGERGGGNPHSFRTATSTTTGGNRQRQLNQQKKQKQLRHHPFMDDTSLLPQDCATSNYPRLIHDEATWKFIQDTYYETVSGPRHEWDADYTQRYKSIHTPRSGFTISDVAIEVKDDGFRGRSVYAGQFIPKGTGVWKSFHLARFETPDELTLFLSKLKRYDLQCDSLLWAYVEKGHGYVSLALDEGSFVNHGESEEVVNLDSNCYALRDIHEGEELLENYSEFIGFHELKWFDVIRGDAWKEPEIEQKAGMTDLLAKSSETYNIFGAPKKRWDGSYSQQHQSYVETTAAEYLTLEKNAMLIVGIALLGACCLVGGGVCVVRKFPYHFFKKEKEGL
mmetsp:Transcript_32967/g.37791  ORF Transcript_32967/g.37791 Transcript_32967/m.37791 type:complete len:356 (+) Transcript_32967:51-1118(+)